MLQTLLSEKFTSQYGSTAKHYLALLQIIGQNLQVKTCFSTKLGQTSYISAINELRYYMTCTTITVLVEKGTGHKEVHTL